MLPTRIPRGAISRALLTVPFCLALVARAQDTAAVSATAATPIAPTTSATVVDSSTVPTSGAHVPIVAITDLSAQGIGGGDASIISDNLASKLQQSGKFRVMERSQMEQILKEQSFQHSGACDGNQCAVEMGKILGLDRIVVGSVGLVGSTYSFNLRLVDVASGEALRTSARTRKGNIDDVLTDLIPEAVADLSDLPQPASPTPAQERKRPLWPWIVSGTVVVAGGAFAAVLLAGDENKTTSNVSSDHFKIVW